MTPGEARNAILNGRRVRMTVGTSPQDPILDVYLDDGLIMSNSVAGWSAGVTECVCEAGSDFLMTYYLLERISLEDLGPVSTG